MDWEPMDQAPRDGSLLDLNFNGVRETDCHFYERHNCWVREHGYPSRLTVFLRQPTGWMRRPADLTMPYESNSDGVQYVPR